MFILMLCASTNLTRPFIASLAIQIAELTDVEATEFSFKLRGACAKVLHKPALLLLHHLVHV